MTPNWQTLLSKGIIPGPQESWEAFNLRAEKLIQIDENQELKESLDLVEKTFGMRPSWARISYTKQGLTLLEAAAVFIDEKRDSHIHVQPWFRKRDNLWLYNKSEIIAHELVHAIRAAFNEPRFEEFLASRVFKSPWRRRLKASQLS